MTPTESIILGTSLGFMGVGLPTIRTLWTGDGHYIRVFFISIVSSICLYIFTNMVVSKNMPFVISNAIGAGLSVSMIAYKIRKKKEKHESLTVPIIETS